MPEPYQRRPLQFSLRALLTLPIVVGLLFGTLRWLGVPPLGSLIVLAIIIVSAAAALLLLVALAGRNND
ncbi:MAG: hypothetical protein ABFC96_00520 [Thermoguttaceae bacterium]